MAEIQSNDSCHNKRGGRRSKKLSTRVDLTPMVDLGFLLITFFIFTTSMTAPKAMALVMPTDESTNNPSQASEEKVIQLLLTANNKVMYYFGTNRQVLEETGYEATGLRLVIQQKQAQLKQQFGAADDLVVIVKPTNESTLQNFTDALDEIQICDVKKYVLLDEDEDDKKLIATR